MGYLIDSNVFIDAERGRLALDDLLAAHGDESFALAAITASELLHGVHRAPTPLIAEQRRAFVEHILAGFAILPFDLDAARMHARLWATLQSTGRMIGAHDLLIAATGLAHGYTVVTRNAREFARVPGLAVLDPEP